MRIPIEREGGPPLYQQIETFLRQGIESGSMAAGTRLPAVRRLAENLQVNRITVETAYDRLEADGLIAGRQGSGTYVLDIGARIPVRGRRREGNLAAVAAGAAGQGQKRGLQQPAAGGGRSSPADQLRRRHRRPAPAVVQGFRPEHPEGHPPPGGYRLQLWRSARFRPAAHHHRPDPCQPGAADDRRQHPHHHRFAAGDHAGRPAAAAARRRGGDREPDLFRGAGYLPLARCAAGRCRPRRGRPAGRRVGGHLPPASPKAALHHPQLPESDRHLSVDPAAAADP